MSQIERESIGDKTDRTSGELQASLHELKATLAKERIARQSIEADRDKFMRLYESLYTQLHNSEKSAKPLSIASFTAPSNFEFHTQAKQVSDELEAPKKQMRAMIESLNQLRERLIQQKTTIRRNDQMKHMFEVQLESLQAENKELTDKNTKLAARERQWRDAVESQGQSQTKVIADQRRRIQELEILSSPIKKSHSDSLYMDHDESQTSPNTQVQHLMDELQQTKAHLSDKLAEFELLTERMQKKESQITSLSSQVKRLESQNLELHTQSEDQDSIQSLRLTLGKSQTMEAFYREELKKRSEQLRRQQEENQILEQEIEDLQVEKIELRRQNAELVTPEQQGSSEDSLLLKIERQRRLIENLNTELEHSKRINSTLVTLLKVKNEKLNFAERRSSQPKSDQKILSRINSITKQEKELMSQLSIQMKRLKSKSSRNLLEEYEDNP